MSSRIFCVGSNATLRANQAGKTAAARVASSILSKRRSRSSTNRLLSSFRCTKQAPTMDCKTTEIMTRRVMTNKSDITTRFF
eukprot:scaffold42656_cov160-Amphora_coffeaeformis.AAC.2